MREKIKVSWGKAKTGMLSPVLSANETPAAEAVAARTVVVTAATAAAATPCFQTVRRTGAAWCVVVGTWVVAMVLMSCSWCLAPAALLRPAYAFSTKGAGPIRQVAENSFRRLSRAVAG
jgi:hypothetical protein